MLKKILYFSAVLLAQPAYSQKPSTIELINADVFEYRESDGRKLRMLLGNVSFKHEGALMLCDSAYLYSETNTLDAFGNVHIKEGDSLNIYGDSLQYYGNSRMANIKGRVILLQNNIKLTTGALSHDMAMNTASYYNRGKIVDGENDLTSKIGVFQVNKNELTFRDSVVLINPKYRMDADTLRYNTVTETAFFHGPTEIISDENHISCSLGWYDTKNNICQFTNKAKLFSKDQSVEDGTSNR